MLFANTSEHFVCVLQIMQRDPVNCQHLNRVAPNYVVVFGLQVLYPLFVLNTCVREGLYYEGFLPWPEDETPRLDHTVKQPQSPLVH